MESARELKRDVRLLERVLGDTVRELDGPRALARAAELRRLAVALRAGHLAGGREALAERIAALDTAELLFVARAFTHYFHLINAAEEQHRIRTLRRRDRPGSPPDGSLHAALLELKRDGATASDVRALLERALVMPVLTAHPTEARRRTALDHLAEVSHVLDALDLRRDEASARRALLERLREAVLALQVTEEARARRPSPLDEIRAGLHVFERTLLDVTPKIYRVLEHALGCLWPGEHFAVPPFLRWGTWIGGDRDGNPNVTSEVTRAALERHRRLALERHLADVSALGRGLSISARRVRGAGLEELEASLERDRARSPEVAARIARYRGEPWREKLWFLRERLRATGLRGDGSFERAEGYLEELRLIERTLCASGLARLAAGRLRDAIRRAEVFGFHLATLDLREHSSVHEAAVADLLRHAGGPDYRALDEAGRVALLQRLVDRGFEAPADRRGLAPETRELLATLDVVGRARRDQGPRACERYIVSFTSGVSDVLEVLVLARAARLLPDELRPVPLLEQVEDLQGAGPLAERLLELQQVRRALRGELEVMIGYSDSGKQAGYFASAVHLQRAQEALADVVDKTGVTLTVFHGRGGAVGRGGGPAGRAIRAQPWRALRGRFRVTEQGETISARYGRAEIASRDLEQMVGAVLIASSPARAREPQAGRDGLIDRAAAKALDAYRALAADPNRLARYATEATPIAAVTELPIGSRPASRRAGLSLEALRAIPWVFSWNQSRHGVPGWFGLGSALEVVIAEEGLEGARRLYATWPFFHALVDNAQLALARADIDVAAHYARLADPDARRVFDLVREEHARTMKTVLAVVGQPRLLGEWPTLARTVERRNPYVDILSHAQIEALRRARTAPGDEERLREVLFTTVSGIAAGLQSAG